MRLFENLNIDLFHKWFNKPIKLTPKEAKILKACELILLRDDRTISVIPGEMDYFIRSNALSYYLHVTSECISFSNHGHTVTRDYRLKFIELIKETIKQKTIVDRQQMLAEMSYNEETLLDKMIEQLSFDGMPLDSFNKNIEIVKD